MKKIEFVQQVRYNSNDIWYYTAIDECYISD